MNSKFLIFFSLLFLSLAKPAYSERKSLSFMEIFLHIQKGVFEAWKDNEESVEKLISCNRNLFEVHKTMKRICNIIQRIVWHDFKNVTDSFKLIALEFASICDELMMCVDGKEELMVLLRRVIYLSPSEFLYRIYLNFLANIQNIVQDIREAFDSLIARNFYNFGYHLGDAIELIFFKNIPRHFHYTHSIKRIQRIVYN